MTAEEWAQWVHGADTLVWSRRIARASWKQSGFAGAQWRATGASKLDRSVHGFFVRGFLRASSSGMMRRMNSSNIGTVNSVSP